MPLRKLFALIFSDSSTVFPEVHLLTGDTDLEISKWHLDDTKLYFSRVLKYFKNLSVVSCKVTQKQRCRMLSPTELAFETSSAMTGIPFSNSFTVESKWRISEEEPNRCRMLGYGQVDFRRRIIGYSSKVKKLSIEGLTEYCSHMVGVVCSKITAATLPSVTATRASAAMRNRLPNPKS